VLICDTSGLLPHFNASDPDHGRVRAAVDSESGPFVVSPFVLVELDYLLVTRQGVDAEVGVLAELAGGAWELPAFGRADLVEATTLMERYRDQAIGLTDASLVVLADRFRTRTLLTLDRRHFDVVRRLSGGRFRLLP
jgi:predicted nucleic acid-binding protein